MRKYCLFLITAAVLSFAVFVGCSNNKTSDSSQATTSAALTETSTESSSATLSENVKDYTIVKNENTPIKVNDLSADNYNIMLESVRNYRGLSSDLFKITNLESLCSSPEFREISVKSSDSNEDDLYYYCAFHNTSNNEVAYLIFSEITLSDSDKTYACGNYVTKLDDTITTYPEDSFDWYSCIADSDK